MRHQPEPPFRHLQRQLSFLRAVEPWVDLRFARPHPFVEAAKNGHIGPYQPRLQQAIDRQPGMRHMARPHCCSRHLPPHQHGIIARQQNRATGRFFFQPGE